MRILVVGIGKVGYAIAEKLVQEKHDVVAVDRSDEVIARVTDSIDVLCVQGNGADTATLAEAGADRADVVIATTASDEANMMCCLLCKRMGTRYAIARIRDPGYADSLQMLQREMDIDKTVNPDKATALEISRIMRYPYATNLEYFAKGRVEMVGFRAQEGDKLVGVPMKDIATVCKGIPHVLYAVMERNDEVIVPGGNTVILPGDKVYVVAETVTINAFFNYLGKSELRVKNVMLMGGGRTSYYLAREIEPMDINVTMLEIDEKRAAFLSEQLPDVNVICADGTDPSVLHQEGIEDSDVFITLTGRDEDNLLTGLVAQKMGIPKVIVKNNRIAYQGLLTSLGLDSVVSPTDITTANLLRYVRGRANTRGTMLQRLYRLLDGKAEAMEFIARQGDGYLGIALKDLHISSGCIVACIVRGRSVIVPFGGDSIEVGDYVIILTTNSGITDLNEVMRK